MPNLASLGRLARLLPGTRGSQARRHAVLSFNVQAGLEQAVLAQSQFEVLVRHLFDRLLNNEAFGEDATLRVAQLAYAIVLPGVLVALFLFPYYHGLPPHPHVRSFWSQSCDHLFYVTYSLVIVGTAAVFQWDLLFPDTLDVFILSSLPITTARLLLARLSAFGMFLALVLLGTTGLSDLFFPAVADLKVGFWRHLAAHTAAVSLSGIFAALALIAAQGVLASLPGRRLYATLAPVLKVLAVLLLLTILSLFPLLAHFLPDLLGTRSVAVHWFPPFWFLGVYELLLHGSAAPPVFHALAHTGLLSILAVAVIALAAYPFAYSRRIRHQIEGIALRQGSASVALLFLRLLHLLVIRTPRSRAIFHFAAQTIARLQRLHLYLAMYAGLGLALVLSSLVVFQLDHDRLAMAVSPSGVRLVLPVLAFWTVAGLRTALRSPLGRAGSWVFRVIDCQPNFEDLRGAEIFVRTVAIVLTLLAAATLHLVSPPELRRPAVTLAQIVIAIGLSLVLTDLFFLTTRSIPFTATRPTSHRELPLTLVRYLVLFPAFVLTVADKEPWVEASLPHLLVTVLAFTAAHAALSAVRKLVLQRPAPVDELLLTGLDLRRD